MTTLETFANIIKWAGGKIEDDRFVIEPGVRIIKHTNLTSDFKDLCSRLNINTRITDDKLSAEFNSRICYMSFPKTPETTAKSDEYNERMVQTYGHTSVYNDFYVSFLVAGITDETVKELLAHTEHKASRLTSSKTKCQTTTLYRIQGSRGQMDEQKKFIRTFLGIREGMSMESVEFNNICNLGAKAAMIVYTMSLKDFRKMITGRLPEMGNETEVREVVSLMLEQLKTHYPILYRDMEPTITREPSTHTYGDIHLNEAGILKYAEIVGSLVDGFQTLFDIGCGRFEIYSALLLASKPIKYVGWDVVDLEWSKRQSPKFVFENADYKSSIDDWIICSMGAVIVSNPPYSEIPQIMSIIKRYGLKYVLMTSDKYLDYFKGATFLGCLSGSTHFSPQPGKELHYIMTNISS